MGKLPYPKHSNINVCNEHLNSLTAKLLVLHTIFENDFNDKSEYFGDSLSRLRINIYGPGATVVIAASAAAAAATSTAAFGPIALAAASVSALGITYVEVNLVAQLKKAFQATSQKFTDLHTTLEKADLVIKDAKDDVKEEITKLNSLTTQIATTNNFALAWAAAPKQLIDELKESIKDLIKLCEDYTASAENKRATNWR